MPTGADAVSVGDRDDRRARYLAQVLPEEEEHAYARECLLTPLAEYPGRSRQAITVRRYYDEFLAHRVPGFEGFECSRCGKEACAHVIAVHQGNLLDRVPSLEDLRRSFHLGAVEGGCLAVLAAMVWLDVAGVRCELVEPIDPWDAEHILYLPIELALQARAQSRSGKDGDLENGPIAAAVNATGG